jgi:hypothetical protein
MEIIYVGVESGCQDGSLERQHLDLTRLARYISARQTAYGPATMANRQLHPLQINPKTGEPFLQLPSPHEHIIITPLRLTDKSAIIDILNDKAVNDWLEVNHI